MMAGENDMTRREREITDPQKIKEILCDCGYLVSRWSVMRIDVEDISAKYRPLPGAEERESDKE